MTESEWLACTDPTPMLDFLRGKASDRKLRLFAVACSLRLAKIDEHSRLAILVAERYSDGLASRQELDAAQAAVHDYCVDCPWDVGREVAEVAAWVAWEVAEEGAEPAAAAAARVPSYDPNEESGWSETMYYAECRAQSDLLRCVIGNPFRPVTLYPAWLHPTVPALAQAIYDDRAFDRLPMLADALEDAGCTNQEILNHCRQSREHVRGCWAVDLLLGKG